MDPNDVNPDTDADRFTDGYEAVAIGPEAVTSASLVPALGDVTGDGAVSNADALAVLALFITKIGPDAEVFRGTGFRHADPSRDGYISNKDALVLQSFFLGALPRLPR